LKHCGLFPIGWTPVTDTTDKRTNERTNERTDGRDRRRDEETSRLFVRPSVRLLDGVWHSL